MAVRKFKGAKGACDKLFSKEVRSFGECQNCGSTKYLQTAHIVSRVYSATRCNFDNAYCLCAKCHYWFGKWPVDFARFVEKMGTDYDELRALAIAGTGKKHDWDAELIKLQEWVQ